VNVPVHQEVFVQAGADAQVELPLAAEDVARCVLERRFGRMRIEVRDEEAFMNGDLVVRPTSSNLNRS
jgi:hypothetical protein